MRSIVSSICSSFVPSICSSFLVLGALAGAAEAHVSISGGPADANKTQLITFSVGHGCTDAASKHLDTAKIRVTIPAGVTGVRALFSDFGRPTVVKSGTTVTHVEWTKPADQLLDGDDAYYQIQIRARVPDAPFSKLKFDIEQTCEDSVTHEKVVVNWNAAEGSTTGEPAAFLPVVPARATGWSKVTVPRALTQDEVATYLGGALIVWRGNEAYSSNPNTAALITATAGVTALAGGLRANDEIWVRY